MPEPGRVHVKTKSAIFDIWPAPSQGTENIVFDARSLDGPNAVITNISGDTAIEIITALFSFLHIGEQAKLASLLQETQNVEGAVEHLRKHGIDDINKLHTSLRNKLPTLSWSQIDNIVNSAVKIVIVETIQKKRDQISALEEKLGQMA